MPDAHELTRTPPRADDPARATQGADAPEALRTELTRASHAGAHASADDPISAQNAHASFRAYHRATRRSRVRALAVVAVLGLVTVGSVGWLYSGSQPQPAAASRHSVAEAVFTAAATATPAAVALPTGQANPSAEPAAVPARAATPPAQLPDTGGPTYSIAVTATGYQAELDECQWVRMNIGASAPIVGAHTKCGGAIVVDMQVGQTVALTGQGLDGSYTVSGSRDAHAGDDAATATAGMGATVILQTCYPIDNGSERLIALTPA